METKIKNKLSFKQLQFIDMNGITVEKETKSSDCERDNYVYFIDGIYYQQSGSHTELDAYLKGIEKVISLKIK